MLYARAADLVAHDPVGLAEARRSLAHFDARPWLAADPDPPLPE